MTTTATLGISTAAPWDLLVASLLNGLHDEFHALSCIAGRCETALIADQRGIAAELLLDDALTGERAKTTGGTIGIGAMLIIGRC